MSGWQARWYELFFDELDTLGVPEPTLDDIAAMDQRCFQRLAQEYPHDDTFTPWR